MIPAIGVLAPLSALAEVLGTAPDPGIPPNNAIPIFEIP